MLALGGTFPFEFPTFTLQSRGGRRPAGRRSRPASRTRPSARPRPPALLKGNDQRGLRWQSRRWARPMNGRIVDVDAGRAAQLSTSICASRARSISTIGWALVGPRVPRRRLALPSAPCRNHRGRRRAAAGKQIDLSALARLRRHAEPGNQRDRGGVAQGDLRRHERDPAQRRAQGVQAHRPVLQRRRRLRRHRRCAEGHDDGRHGGHPAGHLCRRDAARRDGTERLRQRAPDGGGGRQDQRHAASPLQGQGNSPERDPRFSWPATDIFAA